MNKASFVCACATSRGEMQKSILSPFLKPLFFVSLVALSVPNLSAQFQTPGALGALAPANLSKPRPKPPFDLTGTWLHGGGQDNNFRFAPPAGFKLTPEAQVHYDAARKAQAEGKVDRKS